VEENGSGTGIIAINYQFKLNQVKDGLSHTYLLGEKSVDLDAAKSGTSRGDDQGPFVSDPYDILRWAVSGEGAAAQYVPPHRDCQGNPQDSNDVNYGFTGKGIYLFGSAHPQGFNMALCDGSVHYIHYEIAEEVHRRLCNRRDGQTVEVPE
jgi:prepilin-type processing-associated H-X9-DG protein